MNSPGETQTAVSNILNVFFLSARLLFLYNLSEVTLYKILFRGKRITDLQENNCK